MANTSLRSFASGMIIATSIFTAVYYFQPDRAGEEKIVDHETAITEAEVQQYLDNKGYVSIPKQTYQELLNNKAVNQQKPEVNNKEQTPEQAQKETPAPKTNVNPTNEKQPANSSTTNNTNTTEKQPTEKATTNNKTANQQPPKETKQDVAKPIAYQLEVTRGMDSIQIANRLEKAGIVKSGKEFDQFMSNKNWTRAIQIGTYNLNSQMSYEQIGRIITHK